MCVASHPGETCGAASEHPFEQNKRRTHDIWRASLQCGFADAPAAGTCRNTCVRKFRKYIGGPLCGTFWDRHSDIKLIGLLVSVKFLTSKRHSDTKLIGLLVSVKFLTSKRHSDTKLIGLLVSVKFVTSKRHSDTKLIGLLVYIKSSLLSVGF